MAALAVGLNVLENAPGIIKAVVGLVHFAESLFGKGKGGDKRTFVVNAAQSLAKLEGFFVPVGAPKLTVDDSTFGNDIGAVVDAIVKVNNDLGLFQH